MERIFLLDSANGIYIPQQCWEMFKNNPYWDWSGVDQQDQRSLENGPEDEFYWEAWDSVLSNVVIRDLNGQEYCLEHDNDLFLTKKS